MRFVDRDEALAAERAAAEALRSLRGRLGRLLRDPRDGRLHAAVRAWEVQHVEGARVAPGAVELLEAIAGRGLPRGVVTRNTRPTALRTLQAANRQQRAGSFPHGRQETLVETGGFLHGASEVGAVVVGVGVYEAGGQAQALRVDLEGGAARQPDALDGARETLAEAI